MSEKLIEKTISSSEVFKGTFLKVTQDQVVLPNGHRSIREYIKHPGAALIIPVLDDGKLVMLNQYRHPLNKIFLEFPAGKIDPGETSLETAKRELMEETGYQAEDFQFLTTIHPCIGYSDEKIDLYLAKKIKKVSDANPDEGELIETQIISREKLREKVFSGELSDVKTLVAALWILKLNLI